MFTAPAPSAPTLSTSTSQASPSSPTRPSRLRGLSYLRNYTHNHIHPGSSRPTVGRTRSHPSEQDGNPTEANDDARSPPAGTDNTDTMPSSRRGGSRSASRQQSGSDATAGGTGSTSARMTRSRAGSASATTSLRNALSPNNLDGATHSSTISDGTTQAERRDDHKNLPSIRFIPHLDPRAPRPSLAFSTIARTLPDESAIIRVGRYSERDSTPDIPQNTPSAAPVGFKSKVVSRRHCEFWFNDNRWWIKDVKSSSGTFLNHIRLSQPGAESKPYEVKDGDVVQLGIDFRGGEEMIFRCVKIRIECNRGWQQSLNNFNKLTHKRLRNLAKSNSSKKEGEGDAGSTHSSECAICLMSIAPCQSLFVAPCSHVWHYKCIRPILQGPTAPTFLCPNCRAVTDLEADVDEPNGFTDSDDSEVEAAMQVSQQVLSTPATAQNTEAAQLGAATNTPRAASSTNMANGTGPTANTPQLAMQTQTSEIDVLDGVDDAMAGLSFSDAHHVSDDTDSPVEVPSNATAQPVPISTNNAASRARALSPDGTVPDSDFPMTPRNDAGPFVLDGSGGRANNSSRLPEQNQSMDAD